MIFAIYKKKGISSHEALAEIKNKFPGEKVGHAGTLDPLAEGVLVVAVGADTKKLATEVAKEKEYIADIILGQTSATDDAEGPIINTTLNGEEKNPTNNEIATALKKFMGKIEQTPPLYSAVKVKGKPAHTYARKGQPLALKPRVVEIKNIELLEYNYPNLKIKITTGPGVYIRALARDLGENLGTGAYLGGLIRTRVGEYTAESAQAHERYIIDKSTK